MSTLASIPAGEIDKGVKVLFVFNTLTLITRYLWGLIRVKTLIFNNFSGPLSISVEGISECEPAKDAEMEVSQ